MHAGLSVKQAIEAVELEMGIPVAVAQGFDAREFGSKMVNVLWYAFREADVVGMSGEPRLRYRVQVFVDGERVAGVEV